MIIIILLVVSNGCLLLDPGCLALEPGFLALDVICDDTLSAAPRQKSLSLSQAIHWKMLENVISTRRFYWKIRAFSDTLEKLLWIFQYKLVQTHS